MEGGPGPGSRDHITVLICVLPCIWYSGDWREFPKENEFGPNFTKQEAEIRVNLICRPGGQTPPLDMDIKCVLERWVRLLCPGLYCVDGFSPLTGCRAALLSSRAAGSRVYHFSLNCISASVFLVTARQGRLTSNLAEQCYGHSSPLSISRHSRITSIIGSLV